jgi:hypothetical protein
LVYSLSLKYALDADLVAAIDNVTRKTWIDLPARHPRIPVLTPDCLATVFGVVAHVSPHPVKNGLMIHVTEPVRDDAMP